ncbi:CLUMA_CG002153, isoform A [Clunio marinus]|uniref:CLUMA_CG002153, isoform A n=1 Tax=Clunio marinus TaxID=568069 RepID=A0A1J1HJY8_9DIPT|nr:CLUMA_CG002153, isoform A [Clunio marinus]
MKSLAKTLGNPHKYIYRHLYSSSVDNKGGKMTNLELSDIPTEEEIELEVEEVRIRLPWNNGTLAGKWWGSKNQRPIVCMHGWQDNAGTFDRLIPLLPKTESYLAIDLPGHGLSSRVPDGMAYHGIDNLYLLNNLCKEYNWDKISLMGHSMGSVLSFMFASVFPNKVDMLIQIDALKPHVPDPEKVALGLQDRVENFMIADLRNQDKSEPPSYTYEDMIERLFTGTRGSVTKESAQYLLKRNIKRSEKYPGKFYFTRDSRLKNSFSPNFSQPVSKELSKRLKMPHLFIKALHAPFWEKREYYDEVIDILQENENFECHTVDATHHLHLTHPETVAPLISNFIEKHRNVNSKL